MIEFIRAVLIILAAAFGGGLLAAYVEGSNTITFLFATLLSLTLAGIVLTIFGPRLEGRDKHFDD